VVGRRAASVVEEVRSRTGSEKLAVVASAVPAVAVAVVAVWHDIVRRRGWPVAGME